MQSQQRDELYTMAPRVSKPRRKPYREGIPKEDIDKAVELAANAYNQKRFKTIQAAATAYNAPYYATRSRVKGAEPKSSNGGHNKKLTDEKDLAVLAWVNTRLAVGGEVTSRELQLAVRWILRSNNKPDDVSIQ
ncbi:hypothetical protein QBC32DRAFT_366304 [Pseudoneurospora amorphoporcata]|uniref:HTH psq-type domain-containing protein n=1 Tax=Pseudoneurospora amorphoporcata TaxID=241081 RepID=A0AAN6NK46_9PEZI|nr:hypothetical protein QBC32DRAFT_366304 [Pseudoneurospora amorphoporcata]